MIPDFTSAVNKMKEEKIIDENISVEATGKEREDKRKTKEGEVPNKVEQERASKERRENQLGSNDKVKQIEDEGQKSIKKESG